jgi:hypothetical protein
MTDNLPTIMTSSGLQPQSPAYWLQQLLTLVIKTAPGYTANLPGSMVEDISSTDVAALLIADSCRVDLVNSVTPFGANPFILNELGQIYGIPIGLSTNTSVFVQFFGPPGYVIPVGFICSDGVYQYVVQDGGLIDDTGSSTPLFCLASITGIWSVAPGTVNFVITSVPNDVIPSITCNNPESGIPGSGAETETHYRSRVLMAGMAASQGMASYLKTLLRNVPNVQSRLVSVRPSSYYQYAWEVICGGGDPYQIVYAIFQGVLDITSIVGSAIQISGITKVANGVVTTNINHGLITGQTGVLIQNAQGMTAINNIPLTIVVLTATTFSCGINTTSFGTYTGGGIVTPNARNITVSIWDYPDTYQITFVNPPMQTVTMTVGWNTSSVNFVSDAMVAQLTIPAIVDYINNIEVGLPISTYELDAIFLQAIGPVLDPRLIIKMIWAISINGIGVSPTGTTGVIYGDPESYFLTNSTGVSVARNTAP